MSTGAAASAPKLDDLMMAMDVVDTIRHKEDVLARELSLGDRDDELIAKLREIYSQQGITVTDAVLREGVKALKEQRFAYKAPPSGLLTGLFRLWIRRGRIAGILALVLGGYGFFWASDRYNWFSPSEQQIAADTAALETDLPGELQKAVADTTAASKDPAANSQIASFKAAGETGLSDKNASAVRKAISDLTGLRQRLNQEYVLQIVSREGVPSGAARTPDANSNARNYYLIVEAIAADGTVLSLPITSEEDQSTRTVAIFGVRVPEESFRAVQADKRADGIVDDKQLGRKERGFLNPRYIMPAEGGMITTWAK
jgi:hypothetical protein